MGKHIKGGFHCPKSVTGNDSTQEPFTLYVTLKESMETLTAQ